MNLSFVTLFLFVVICDFLIPLFPHRAAPSASEFSMNVLAEDDKHCRNASEPNFNIYLNVHFVNKKAKSI